MPCHQGPRSRVRALRATLFAALALLPCAAALAAGSDFDAGVAAARSGQYAEAVRHFERAREQGLDTPALHHNLGVAYYRLGRLEEARRSFRRAARSPGMRALSHYNLGLVAQKAGDDAAARFWFRKAHQGAETARLRRLAAKQLGLADPATRRYRAYLEGFAGYDSNPALADEDAEVVGDRDAEGDAIFGALATGEAVLWGDWSSGLSVKGSGYADFHPDLDEEDLGSLAGGLGVHHSPGRWRHELEVLAGQLWLGREAFQTSAGAQLRSLRQLGRLGAGELRLRSEYADGDDGNGFGYVTGWSHAARVRLLGRHAGWRWRIHYELEYEDRDDLRIDGTAGVDFFSVSPLRNEVGASLERALFGSLSGAVGAAYRRSDYRDEEIRSGVEQGRRSDDRFEVRAGLAHPLGAGWTARLESSYWHNRSHCDADACERFDYERVDALLSIGRSF